MQDPCYSALSMLSQGCWVAILTMYATDFSAELANEELIPERVCIPDDHLLKCFVG